METKKHVMSVCLILVVLAFWGGNVSAYDMADYFPLNQGDTWIHKGKTAHPLESIYLPVTLKFIINGTEVVNGVETTKREFGEGGSYHCYAIDSEGVKWYKWHHEGFGYYVVYDLPEIIFPARLDVGETYQGSFSASVYSTDDDSLMYTVTGNNTVTLESVEDVAVIAGSFKDCLKLTTSENWQTTDGSMSRATEKTIWYARNVGLIKEESYSPIEGEMTLADTRQLIYATVDGVQYGCAMTYVLGADSGDLNTLRRFRDEVLSKTPAGQTMIHLYYELSPVMVKAMEDNALFKELVRQIIYRMLPVIKRLIE